MSNGFRRSGGHRGGHRSRTRPPPDVAVAVVEVGMAAFTWMVAHCRTCEDAYELSDRVSGAIWRPVGVARSSLSLSADYARVRLSSGQPLPRLSSRAPPPPREAADSCPPKQWVARLAKGAEKENDSSAQGEDKEPEDPALQSCWTERRSSYVARAL